MYCGYITTLHNLRKHSNADRLQCVEVFGQNVIVDLSYYEGQKVVFFPSDGQLSEEFATKNNLVRKKDENGNEIGTEYQLTATTQSDDRAYNDAMNEYNYNKAKYDQDIQAINAKIEIIHGQDKDLELRLKQLDTEETAISTEMEAVKKVISKNVDSSFKTFNA